MSTARCAHLIVTAIDHQLSEAWIARNPVLFFSYVGQYCPILVSWWVARIDRFLLQWDVVCIQACQVCGTRKDRCIQSGTQGKERHALTMGLSHLLDAGHQCTRVSLADSGDFKKDSIEAFALYVSWLSADVLFKVACLLQRVKGVSFECATIYWKHAVTKPMHTDVNR